MLSIDQRNPQLAARLCSSFLDWKKYGEARQLLMKAQLTRIRDTKGVSKDVYEIASRGLA